MPVFWEFLFRTPLPNTNNYFVIRQRDISIAYQRKEIKRSFLLRKWKISLPFQPGFFLQSGEGEEGGLVIEVSNWAAAGLGTTTDGIWFFLNEGKRAGASDFPVQHKKTTCTHWYWTWRELKFLRWRGGYKFNRMGVGGKNRKLSIPQTKGNY